MLLTVCHRALGTFPREVCSSKVGLAAQRGTLGSWSTFQKQQRRELQGRGRHVRAL